MKPNIQKIERERIRLGLTKIEFSRRIGLSISAYGKITDNESTKWKTLSKIASVLHVDPRDLLAR